MFGTAAPRPRDLQGRRVAGYYGSLSAWVDVRLLAHAAEAMPNWCFLLIGPVRTDITELNPCRTL